MVEISKGQAGNQAGARYVFVVLPIILVAAVILSLAIGRYHIPIIRAARILLATIIPGTASGNPAWNEEEWIVVHFVRLPRLVCAAVAGAGLALSGAVLQGLFRNPLVAPQIIGISSGASFGGILAILIGLSSYGVVSSAFAFGIFSMILVFGLSRLAGRTGILSVVLSGIIVGGMFGALVGLIQYIANPETKLPDIVYWLLGSFAGADWNKAASIGLPTICAGAVLLLMRWRVNLLSLGDTDSSALGLKVDALRWVCLGLVSLIVAAQVSISGGVGWVGLVVPHFARMLVGSDHRKLLPAATLMGAIYLLLIDDIARTLISQEIPIGILTAMVGTPVFGLMFWKTQARGWATHD
jgi:iron complex transport system permease protein